MGTEGGGGFSGTSGSSSVLELSDSLEVSSIKCLCSRSIITDISKRRSFSAIRKKVFVFSKKKREKKGRKKLKFFRSPPSGNNLNK